MKHKDGLPGRIRRFGAMGLFLLLGSILAWPQTANTSAGPTTDAMTAAVRELQEEVRELRNAVVELRSEAGQYRAETEQLRRRTSRLTVRQRRLRGLPAGCAQPQPAFRARRQRPWRTGSLLWKNPRSC